MSNLIIFVAVAAAVGCYLLWGLFSEEINEEAQLHRDQFDAYVQHLNRTREADARKQEFMSQMKRISDAWDMR